MGDVRALVIIERAYRGAVETQFVDALYFLREMNHQLRGRVDLVLRGLAVTYALAAPGTPALRLSGRLLDSLPDPRGSVGALVGDGMRITVDAHDLQRLGCGPERLLPGVTSRDTTDLVGIWEDYHGIWYL